jgi:Osmosensitive K+ channel histidine kinase
MLLAIVAIASFQSYWLYKNFNEQEQNLAFRTNVLFREAIQRIRAAQLKTDSTLDVQFHTRYDAMETLKIVSEEIRNDTIRKLLEGPRVGLVFNKLEARINDSTKTRVSKDSIRKIHVLKSPKGAAAFIQIFRDVEEGLQDSITVDELSARFSALMQEENIHIPFRITRIEAPPRIEPMHTLEPLPPRNEVTIGISKPVTFRLQLENTTWYNIRHMWGQITVSLLLVGLTVLSFVLLLRNLIQQRKLTQLKNDFISNITHELKTPIATVNVAIEALRNFNALDDPQRTRQYLDISANELQRLSLLVDKVLKLSMFEKRQIDLRKENVDLKQLAEEVTASMKLQFEKYKAQVSIKTSGEHFTILADRLHITSVLFNLLDNALKYSKEHPTIQIDIIYTPNAMEMHITDNGIGIAPEFKKKIFDKFFRVPTGNTHNVKGYGLGLSYVAYVIQRHQASIEVESQPGIGSRFIIKFPTTT